MDREAWWATLHGFARVRHDLATKPLPRTATSITTRYGNSVLVGEEVKMMCVCVCVCVCNVTEP